MKLNQLVMVKVSVKEIRSDDAIRKAWHLESMSSRFSEL